MAASRGASRKASKKASKKAGEGAHARAFSTRGWGGFLVHPAGAIYADTAHRGADLHCLLRAPEPVNHEMAFDDFRTINGGPHRVLIRWYQPKSCETIILHCSEHYISRKLSLWAYQRRQSTVSPEAEGGVDCFFAQTLDAPAFEAHRLSGQLSDGGRWIFQAPDGPIFGLCITQAAGDGDAEHADDLRLRGLSLMGGPPGRGAIQVVGHRFGPGPLRDPLAPETWPLQLSDASTLRLSLPAARGVRVLKFSFPVVGSGRALRAWLQRGFGLFAGDTAIPHQLKIVGDAPGAVWREWQVFCRLYAVIDAPRLEIRLPQRKSHILVLNRLEVVDEKAWQQSLEANFAVAGNAALKQPDWKAVPNSDTTHRGPPFAAILREAGSRAQYALYADGLLSFAWPGSRRHHLFFAFLWQGQSFDARHLRRHYDGSGALILTLEKGSDILRLKFTCASGGLALDIQNRSPAVSEFGLEMALICELNAQALAFKREGGGGILAARGSQFQLMGDWPEATQKRGGALAFKFSLPAINPPHAGENPPQTDTNPPLLLGLALQKTPIQLPIAPQRSEIAPLPALSSVKASESTGSLMVDLGEANWQGLLEGLWRRIPDFMGVDGRVDYGLYPSGYEGMVFGLEEDYLFRGMALWRGGTQVLSLFRATYLRPDFLDKTHYLRDLRHALLPWQFWKLSQLTGFAFTQLTAQERGMILDCGHWMEAAFQRSQALAQSDPDLYGELLPPFRYGGDLAFTTQALHSNAMAYAGLRSLYELTGERFWQARAQHLRKNLIRIWHGLAKDGHFPLSTGGGAPGDYEPLMICGMVLWVDFFEPGDEIPRAMFRWMLENDCLYQGLPRFNFWGDGDSIDAHYAIGHLMHALRLGERAYFIQGLKTHLRTAMDGSIFAFAEVSGLNPPAEMLQPLPNRRVYNAAPCVGGLGMALYLLRQAYITRLWDEGGWPREGLRLFAGLPPELWGQKLKLEHLPTAMGPITIRGEAQGPNWKIHVEHATLREVEAVTRRGERVKIPVGRPHLLPG